MENWPDRHIPTSHILTLATKELGPLSHVQAHMGPWVNIKLQPSLPPFPHHYFTEPSWVTPGLGSCPGCSQWNKLWQLLPAQTQPSHEEGSYGEGIALGTEVHNQYLHGLGFRGKVINSVQQGGLTSASSSLFLGGGLWEQGRFAFAVSQQKVCAQLLAQAFSLCWDLIRSACHRGQVFLRTPSTKKPV